MPPTSSKQARHQLDLSRVTSSLRASLSPSRPLARRAGLLGRALAHGRRWSPCQPAAQGVEGRRDSLLHEPLRPGSRERASADLVGYNRRNLVLARGGDWRRPETDFVLLLFLELCRLVENTFIILSVIVFLWFMIISGNSLIKGAQRAAKKGSGCWGADCARATPVPIGQSFDPSEPGLCGPLRETANLRDMPR